MRSIVSRVIPKSVKQKIRQSSFLERRYGRKFARTSKRIDICAAQFAHFFHLGGLGSIEGKTCLEIGSGWVLSHALVCYLMGAKRVVATDILPHAQPKLIRDSIQNAVIYIPREILAPFGDHSRLRHRTNIIQEIKNFSFEELEKLGIEYQSPVDFSCQKLDIKADLIFSFSVLEHVAREDIQNLLINAADILSDEGSMIHEIHLEDHLNFHQDPFAFFTLPASSYGREKQGSRGNRIRYSEWLRIFQSIPNTVSRPLYAHRRVDKPFPERIDPSIVHTGEDDLRVSHVGMITRKSKS
ncbi:MAG TPA: hypothetical protein ENN03_06575 [bacterium]|nr:hypothetical protein [bacterium]